MTTDTIDTSTFGRYLRSLRLSGAGRTQRQVAAAAGISEVDYSKLEAHRLPPPDMVTLAGLRHVLDADRAVLERLVHAWQPAPPDPPGWAIACGPGGCRVQRVGKS
jgi:transcriptional regulator with XRE-family HTH domain